MFENFKKQVQSCGRYYIYGAQHHAHAMCVALKCLVPEARAESFFVADKEGNPCEIEGIPVRIIYESEQFPRDIPVLIATSEKYYAEILEILEKHKFKRNINASFGGVFDNEVRELYFKRKYKDYALLHDMPLPENEGDFSVCMYMAKSAVDRTLVQADEEGPYVKSVQAGAALTERQAADYSDNVGENISRKNRNYCECTVTYYAWKNATEDYVGLCHYRRRFRWDEKDLKILEGGMADVVLPNPVITVKGDYTIHYKPYIEEAVFDTMLQVLKEYYPAYYETALEVLQGDLFYPCNIVLAKKEIFSAYAEWMFDVLFKVEAVCGDETVRTDRYLGYLAEHLTTFYFIKNKKAMNIAHSRMEILK